MIFHLPDRGCCWAKLFLLTSSLIVVFLTTHSTAIYHPLDLAAISRTLQPDTNRLNDSSYFRQWLRIAYSPSALKLAHASGLTQWDYNINITEHNQAATIRSSQDGAKFAHIVSAAVSQFRLNSSTDEEAKGIQRRLSLLGDAALPSSELDELHLLINHMQSVYSTTWICFNPNGDLEEIALLPRDECPQAMRLNVEPSLVDYLRHSWDLDKRKYVWTKWRDVSGRAIRANFTRYVELKNKAAKMTGYRDAGQMWRSEYARESMGYNDSTFLKDLDSMWHTIRPLYEEVHAYVRGVLRRRFPDQNIHPHGPIPAHLAGEMFSQDWLSVLPFAQLYPSKPLLDVTEEMLLQNYTIRRMFELSEEFQKDLGLIPMPDTFWKYSMFEEPKDGRKVVCHASAWDLKEDNDVRIKMCTKVTMEDLVTIHHEMGHIQYDLQYADQLSFYRDGANRGFHEAVGDTLALSVKTPKHLAWLGLLKNNVEDDESDLNYMFATALDKIVFLPFAYVMDSYRYDIFAGRISFDQLNAGWWNYIYKYQGLVPPVPRSEWDFDAGAKYHIASDTEYMRYFISYILQFQFHKALCHAAGHTGPLYQCDINKSRDAGKLFSDMLSMGSSKPWQFALEKITGSRRMSAAPLVEFFQPLIKKLRIINQQNGDVPGWFV